MRVDNAIQPQRNRREISEHDNPPPANAIAPTTPRSSGAHNKPTSPSLYADYTLQQRTQLADSYADSVSAKIAGIESGSEEKRNFKFQDARPFLSPSGYFGAGLQAAGYDPNATINTKTDHYTGIWRPQHHHGSSEHDYKAWEIAAGALAHDRPSSGGNFDFDRLRISPAAAAQVKNLESIGARLQNRWKQDVADPLQASGGGLASRSGKADASTAQSILQDLQGDKTAFRRLSPTGQQAVSQALGKDGQAIIPNIYGYPIAGHAFVPSKPYDGNWEQRPNQGLLLGLNQRSVTEINGDKDFAKWAQENRDQVLQSFNASDRQGGLDAHWPKAGDVLDNLAAGRKVSYPGYKNLVNDQRIPVGETFNYTRARDADYQLKYGKLDPAADDKGGSLASQYESVNEKNAAWADQTEVFGAAQQNWKKAKEYWGESFGYVPGIGNLGNIAFGVHDSRHGMTAQDRRGGTVGATISGLQLAHEGALATTGAAGLEATAGAEARSAANAGGAGSAVRALDPKAGGLRFSPPQHINGQVGYPLSPTKAPRLGLDEPATLRRSQSDSALSRGYKPDTDSPARSAPEKDIDLPPARPFAAGTTERASLRPANPLPDIVSTSSSSTDFATPARGNSVQSSARGGSVLNGMGGNSVQSSMRGNLAAIPRPLDPDADFKRLFPGGMTQAESYLKDKSLNMNRSPGHLASDHAQAPESWPGIAQEERNRLMDRYMKVWDPEPKRADYGTEQEFTASHHDYTTKMAKYQDNGNFDVPKYWDDLISKQNNDFRTYVDNQSKRLAVATKAYDDYTGNPGTSTAKPDDPYTVRKLMTAEQASKRDEIFTQREALNFGDNRFFQLDDRSVKELRNSILPRIGPFKTNRLADSLTAKKANLEDELYRYAGNIKPSREVLEAHKKELQTRFNNDVDVAVKSQDLLLKRVTLYGAATGVGTAVGGGIAAAVKGK